MKDYKVEVVSCSKELSVREKIQLKDTTTANKIDNLTQDGDIVIPVAYHAQLHIVNPASENGEYDVYVFVDNDGNKFITGSSSLWSSYIDIYDEMLNAGETDFSICVTRKPSKKREGKDFLTCSLV